MRVPPAAVHFPKEDRAWILSRIDSCLESGRLTLGEYGAELEEAFSNLCGTRHGVAVSSGTSALEIILRVLDVKGREVVVPTNTFFATPAAVIHAGGRVRFAECDPATFALSAAALPELIGPQTAAVIVVHIGGVITPAINEIVSTCEAAGVPLIEDAAHAHGSRLLGRSAGSFGRAAAFSFYPTKVITSGEGGIIVTNDAALYKESLIYRDQGKEGFATNFHVRLGANWRMSEPHAVIGLAQLRRLGDFIDRRQEIAASYTEGLRSIAGVRRLCVPDELHCNYYKYIVMLDGVDRASLKKIMRERFSVGLSGEVYETPCHLQPIFAGSRQGPLPQSEHLCANHICLPVSAKMTRDEAEYVLESLERSLVILGVDDLNKRD
jgi:dTDP-4-amino-4,6-dideoxygalactose transaminase